MAKRTDRKFSLLERHERLTPEVKNRLEQKRGRLQKKIDHIDGLLRKPTLRRELK